MYHEILFAISGCNEDCPESDFGIWNPIISSPELQHLFILSAFSALRSEAQSSRFSSCLQGCRHGTCQVTRNVSQDALEALHSWNFMGTISLLELCHHSWPPGSAISCPSVSVVGVSCDVFRVVLIDLFTFLSSLYYSYVQQVGQYKVKVVGRQAKNLVAGLTFVLISERVLTYFSHCHQDSSSQPGLVSFQAQKRSCFFKCRYPIIFNFITWNLDFWSKLAF